MLRKDLFECRNLFPVHIAFKGDMMLVFFFFKKKSVKRVILKVSNALGCHF